MAIGYYPFVGKAIESGMSFNAFYRWARQAEGVQTERRATMLTYWQNTAKGQQYKGAIALTPSEGYPQERYFTGPKHTGRKNPYLYTVSYTAREEKGGDFTRLAVSVISKEQLTVDQVLNQAKAWADKSPELYGLEAEGFAIDQIEDMRLPVMTQ